jgi:peptidoglycan/LPS O-acetylase OafA/YrhL
MSHPTPRSGFRADLQGLRAVAVLLVLIYHLSPGRLPGGFLGIDVFFVLSGFLITRMLAGERATTGGITFGRFIARRSRRLLPAAGVVLVTTLTVALVALSPTRWAETAWHVAFSALQLENWALVAERTDYLNPETGPVLTQHFWTLSVEWQIYLLWAALFALAAVARRARRLAAFATVAVIVLTLVSFAFSVWFTAAEPAAGYLVTPSRIWEFGAGAIVALIAWRPRSRAAREAVGWLSIAAIVGIAIAPPATAYPGWAASIPVLATAALLLTGDPDRPTGLERVLSLRPLVVVGDLSYTIYLWHWPVLLVFLELAGLTSPGLLGAALVTAITFALAALTSRFVERPVWRARVTRRTVLPVLAAAIVPILIAGGLTVYFAAARQRLAEAAGDAAHPGALALDPAYAGAIPDAALVPDLAVAYDDQGPIGPDDHCMRASEVPIICELGDRAGTRTVVVVGDSHAWQWVAAFDELARRSGWRLETLTRPSCPLGVTDVAVPGGRIDETCPLWRAAVMEHLLAERPDLVVTAGLTPYGYAFAEYEVLPADRLADGYVAVWDELRDSGIEVIAIRDGPYFPDDMLECVASGTPDCGGARADVLDPHADPLVIAADRSGVPLLDLTDAICGARRCDAVIGNVVVYRDHHHFTATYTLTMLDALTDRLREAGITGLSAGDDR